MNRINRFRQGLARVFDDDLHTRQWHNYVDYAIIGLIIVSTISVFVSTFEVSPTVERVLQVVNISTLIIFTVEVSLRIWVADLLDERYKGFCGRLRYCCSFYGLIDVLSTYPFYVHFIFPIPYNILRIVRVARLFRIFRYMRSFRILHAAVTSKGKEILISLQFLFIITVILSFFLFFCEHSAQPDAYGNGLDSFMWAFVQYIGDPGEIAANPPVTVIGRVIACLIGILGIAIFAVPAGLVGAGFSEAVEEENRKDKIAADIDKLHRAFERKLDRLTDFQIVPQYVSFYDLQTRLGMKPDDIFDAVAASVDFRLINMAATQPVEEHANDRLAVEHFVVNRPYGCLIDRCSRVTIVSVSSLADPVIGNFSYYLAKMGGFNYISREIGELRPYKSYLRFDSVDSEPNLALFMEDVERLSSREGLWIINLLVSSGANEPTYPTQCHFLIGGAKGDAGCEDPNITIKDIALYRKLYTEIAEVLETRFGMLCDQQRYHDDSSRNLYVRKLSCAASLNSMTMRIAWSAVCWDSRRISIAQTIANSIRSNIEPGRAQLDDNLTELKRKATGFDDYQY